MLCALSLASDMPCFNFYWLKN